MRRGAPSPCGLQKTSGLTRFRWPPAGLFHRRQRTQRLGRMAKDAAHAAPRRQPILAALRRTLLLALLAATFGISASSAETLTTHRIPAALAVEAASETVAACAKDGYRETAVVMDADG